jgi:hypothetical protein
VFVGAGFAMVLCPLLIIVVAFLGRHGNQIEAAVVMSGIYVIAQVIWGACCYRLYRLSSTRRLR